MTDLLHTETIGNKTILFIGDPGVKERLNENILKQLITEANFGISEMLKRFPELQQKEIIIHIKNLEIASLSILADADKYTIFVSAGSIIKYGAVHSGSFAHELMHKTDQLDGLIDNLKKELGSTEHMSMLQTEGLYKEIVESHKIKTPINQILYGKERSFIDIIRNNISDIFVERNLTLIGIAKDSNEKKEHHEICSFFVTELADPENYKNMTTSQIFVLYTIIGFLAISLIRQYLPKSKEYLYEFALYEKKWLECANTLKNMYIDDRIPEKEKNELQKEILEYYKKFTEIVEKGVTLYEREIGKGCIYPLFQFNDSGKSKIAELIRWWYSHLHKWMLADNSYLAGPLRDLIFDLTTMQNSTIKLYISFFDAVAAEAENKAFIKEQKENSIATFDKSKQELNNLMIEYKNRTEISEDEIAKIVNELIQADDAAGIALDSLSKSEGKAVAYAEHTYGSALKDYSNYVNKLKTLSEQLSSGKITFNQLRTKLLELKRLAE